MCEYCSNTGFVTRIFLTIPLRQHQAMHQPTDIPWVPDPITRSVPCPCCSPDLHSATMSWHRKKDLKEAGYGETDE